MNTREFNKQYKDYFVILPIGGRETDCKLDYESRERFNQLCESSDLNTIIRMSILKWEIIAASYLTDRPITSDGGWTTCALCRIFIDVHHCKGCPVMAKTGTASCYKTPYTDFAHYCYEDNDYFRTAKAEIRFLKSLLQC
jgi:hypothetical protein